MGSKLVYVILFVELLCLASTQAQDEFDEFPFENLDADDREEAVRDFEEANTLEDGYEERLARTLEEAALASENDQEEEVRMFQDLVERAVAEEFARSLSEEEVRALEDEEDVAKEFEAAAAENDVRGLVNSAEEVRMFDDENEENLRELEQETGDEQDLEERQWRSSRRRRPAVRSSRPLRRSQLIDRPVITRRCQGPGNFTVRSHCARYLECSARLYYGTRKTCPTGNLFDNVSRKCLKTSDVENCMV